MKDVRIETPDVCNKFNIGGVLSHACRRLCRCKRSTVFEIVRYFGTNSFLGLDRYQQRNKSTEFLNFKKMSSPTKKLPKITRNNHANVKLSRKHRVSNIKRKKLLVFNTTRFLHLPRVSLWRKFARSTSRDAVRRIQSSQIRLCSYTPGVVRLDFSSILTRTPPSFRLFLHSF